MSQVQALRCPEAGLRGHHLGIAIGRHRQGEGMLQRAGGVLIPAQHRRGIGLRHGGIGGGRWFRGLLVEHDTGEALSRASGGRGATQQAEGATGLGGVRGDGRQESRQHRLGSIVAAQSLQRLQALDIHLQTQSWGHRDHLVTEVDHGVVLLLLQQAGQGWREQRPERLPSRWPVAAGAEIHLCQGIAQGGHGFVGFLIEAPQCLQESGAVGLPVVG